jgi:hypothetical protein
LALRIGRFQGTAGSGVALYWGSGKIVIDLAVY